MYRLALDHKARQIVLIAGILLAASLLALFLHRSASAQDTTISYPEGSKEVVATFTAEDPEDDTVTWSVADGGAGTVDFKIGSSNGVLEFLSSPDYEAPTGGDANDSNTYTATVTATDTATPTANTETFDVTVKVTNEAETGKVIWTVDPDGDGDLTANVPPAKPIVQFQVGATLSVPATGGVTDGDVLTTTKDVTERLQWHRSPSKTGPWTAIKGATGASYTTTTDDVNMYLRVEAFYNVSPTAREESASLTSDYPVLASRSSNDAPEFSPAAVKRSVDEGKKGGTVGAPVTATDDITNALSYVLGGDDAARFEIDQKTGQIKTSVDLDREGGAVAVAGTLGSCAGASAGSPDTSCTVTVTATDSAGAVSDPVATVTITITNVDEKPKFTSGYKMASVAEGTTVVDENADTDDDPTTTAVDADSAIYTASDEDGRSLTYSVIGPDGARFQLTDARALSFRTKPDYEKPADANRDNVYEVTVRASDGTMNADRAVRVTVTDENEKPTVAGKNSVSYPENSKTAVATFTATDPEDDTITWSVADGGAGTVDFKIGSSNGVLEFLSSPDFEAPTGGDDDDSNTYTATVTATDTAATPNTDTFDVTVKVTNLAETGKITWTVDPDGDGALAANIPPAKPIVQFQVGATLTASATDGDIEGGTKTVTENVRWQWHRGSARISGATSAEYTTTTEDVGKRLRVMVSYTVDAVGGGREESAVLTSDYPVLAARSSNDAPVFSPSTIKRSVDEGKKGKNVGAPVKATDDINNALSYTLGGADAARFEIDQKTGQIKTSVDLDREGTAVAVAGTLGSCADAGAAADTSCTVTVTATDSAGAVSDPATVTITITSVDEKPKFSSGYKMASVAEGATVVDENADSDDDPTTTAAEADSAVYAASDQDGVLVNLSLMGPDAARFTLTSDDALSFRTKPDYEKPADANRDNVYEVTVRASDGTMHDDRAVRVTVTDRNEKPAITLVPATGLRISGSTSESYPENGSGAVATYTAMGPNAASATWRLTGADRSDFRLSGSGASRMLMFRSSPDYENPGSADGDNTYTVTLNASANGESDTRTVTVTVTDVDEDAAGQTLLQRFDTSGNGSIERSEVITAINAYLDGGTGAPSRADVIGVINLYLDS